MATKKFIIPENVLSKTTMGLLSFHPSSFKNHEGIAYWGGYDHEDTVYITTCIIPEATSGPFEVHTTPLANARVVNLLNSQGLVLLAQVHSHPEDLIRHSMGDDKFAFMPYEGYLSIVVPYYAHNGMMPIYTCGFHIYTNGKFEPLPDSWVLNNVNIVPDCIDLRGG